MASPFGIAYGIGAGLSGVPGAIMQGQERAQQMSLKNLQLQDLQRKMQEEQAFNQVMSEQVAPPMVQAPVMEEMPRAMTAPDQAYEPAGTMHVPTGRTASQQYEFGSQYEQQAYELSQRAERLRQMGLGRTAMKLQEEATKYGSLHQESLGQDAASSILRGGADAPAKLAKLGWPGVTRVGRDGDTFFVEDQTGNITTMDYNDLAALSAGKANLSSILQKIGTSENQARSREFAAKEASRRAAEKAKADALALEQRLAASKDIARIRASAQGQTFAGAKTPAKIATWNFAEGLIRRENPNASEAEILQLTGKHPLVSAAAASSDKTDRNIAAKMIDVIRKTAVVTPGSPEEAELKRLQEIALPPVYGRKKQAGKPTSPSIPSPKSKAEYDLLPRGSQYMKDGKIYVKG